MTMTAPEHVLSLPARRRLRRESLLLPAAGESIKLREPNRASPRLAIYRRRSIEKSMSASMARQDAECAAFVEQLGGVHDPDRDVYADDDVSAKGGAYRPGMEALLRAVKAGRYDGVVVWELPRFLRNKRESLIVREILMSAACDLYNVRFPAVSLWGPTSIVFDVLVDAAVTEIETTAARISSWHRYMSSVGAARCRAPWGLRAVDSERFVAGRAAPLRMFAPDEQPRAELGGRSRADVLREAVNDVLGGVSVGCVVRAWNEAGYPSPQGGLWSRTGLTKLLRNPALCGYGHYGGKLLDATGAELVPGGTEPPMRVGTPLIDEHTWAQLEVLLAARSTRRVSSNQSLLRGLVRCGRCGANMVRNGGPASRYGGYYVCTQSDRAGGCPGNAISARRLEPIITAAVIEVLRDPELLAAARETNAPNARRVVDQLQDQLERRYRRLDEVEELWLDVEVKDARAKARFATRRAKLESEIKQLRAQLADATARSSGRNLALLAAGDDLEQAFESLATAAKSTLLGELIDCVVIGPSVKGTRFDPTRISVRWIEG